MRLYNFTQFVNEGWFLSKNIPQFEQMVDFVFKPGSGELRHQDILRTKVWPAIISENKARFIAKYPTVEHLEKELAEFRAKVDKPNDAFGGPEARVKNRFLTLCVILMVHAQCKRGLFTAEDTKKDYSNLCLVAYDHLIGELDSTLLGYMDLVADQWHWIIDKV